MATLVGTLAHRRAAFGLHGHVLRDLEALLPVRRGGGDPYRFYERIADDLLDAVPRGRTSDLVSGFAAALPLTVIADLLGVPDEHAERYRLGAPLARLEAAVAVRRPAERMPALRVAGRLERRRSAMIRGFTRFPVAG
jgi:cytochrome P450